MKLLAKIRQKSTRGRIALGLVSITITLMLAGSFIGLLPNHDAQQAASRARLAEVVAFQSTLLVTHNDLNRMKAILEIILERGSDIRFASIEHTSGDILAQVGEGDITALDKVSVPVWSGGEKWGEVNLFFEKRYPSGWLAFFYQPLVHYILFVAAISFAFFYFYLGRMLKLLDPAQAIPDRVRSALDTMAEGLLVLDAKQNIVLANQAFAHIVDRSPQALIGVDTRSFDWQNLEGQKLPGSASPWVQALRSGRAVTGQRVRLVKAEGISHTFMVNCSPVLANSGKAGGVLVSFDDVTLLEQKEIELRKSKEEAELANRSKSDFLANMSHEIRTPMNAIMGFTEVLRRGYGNGQNSSQYLETIAKNSRHLLELINDILDLSKVESGQIDVERIPCALHEIVQDVVEVLGISAKNKGIALSFKPAGALPAEIHSDPARVRQILTNLIGNAVKFTDQGSVTVVTRYDAKKGGPIYVDVTDTGIGMSEAQQTRVFAPFVQADSSITRRYGGTGLGLAISKKFALALGGDIEVRSQPGKGSCFTLSIDPGAVDKTQLLAPEQLLNSNNALAQEQTVWKMPAARVLVVDDSEENCDLIDLVLRHQGLEVERASNGAQALEMVGKKDYRLILMDVQMPVMDGYTAVRKMRERNITVPIVALTAHAMKGIEQRCIDAGFDGHMGKPIKIDVLLASVADYLGGERIEGPAHAAVPMPRPVRPLAGASRRRPGAVAPIVSILPSNEKYKPIIAKFVARLELQLQEMREALQNKAYEQLAELAHRLKGSAGTVGFYVFTEPFHRLELAARKGDAATAAGALSEVEALFERIDRSQLDQAEPGQSLPNANQQL